MVKILQAYNFAKQNTFALNGEILAATLIDSNRIAISSAEQFIEIYDIVDRVRMVDEKYGDESNEGTKSSAVVNEERLPTKHTLATVGEVVNLIYCEAGKYLVTLEKENVATPIHTNSSSISCTSTSNNTTIYSEDDTKMFVRIYGNFLKFPESKLADLPITIRIASMTTPNAHLVKSIDVIELPLRSPPDIIQCCQISGNIIVSSKERIFLYEYTQCVHESTQPRFKYIDFLPFTFFVHLNFVPLKLKIAENVIACMNNRYCIAFRVVDNLASNICTTIDGGIQNAMPFTYDIDDNADLEVEDVISNLDTSMASKSSVGHPSIHSHKSFETDSLETTVSGSPLNSLPGRTPIDFNVARIVNSVCGQDFEMDLKSQWEQNDPENGNNMIGGKCNIAYDTHELIIMPTKANEIKIKLVNESKVMNVQRISSNGKIISACNEEDVMQYDIRKLLQICMKTSEPGGGRVVDILRCLDLKAIYQRNENDEEDMKNPEYDMGNQQIPGAISTSKHVNRRTLKSNKHQCCIGFGLLVASSVDGYLYQFCAQGKWYNENEKPIAIYSFTAPVLQVHINDYVIYAVTTESVETHTSRIGHKLFNNRFEYPAIANLFPEESSPDINAPIAVVGLYAFLHVQYVCVNRNNIVLISNGALHTANASSSADSNSTVLKRRSIIEGKRNIAARLIAEAKAKHNLLRTSYINSQSVTNEWTLYNLEVPPVEQIVDDLESVAETYRAASSSNFYALMEEAHVMLRMSISLQFNKLNKERESQLRHKFITNCRKLADLSIRSKKKEIHIQAPAFYNMCNMQLSEIYENYINNSFYIDDEICQDMPKLATPDDDIVIKRDQLNGLIYTVKLLLMNLGTDRLKASFLNQLVKPFLTPVRIIKQGITKVPLSLEFFNLFVKYSPEDIPAVILCSPVVADSIAGEVINYLKCLDSLSANDNLLLAVTACRMSNYTLSQDVISRTNRHDLAVALIKYKNVLFDDTTALFQNQKSKSAENYANTLLKGSLSLHNKPECKRKPCLNNQSGNISTVGHEVVSFSEFTETVLLATEKNELIEAISDVFIHALCVEHSITLEIILQLFLNFIASHIGQKGYQTSQKVFVNILQVYYYDLFDVNPLNTNQDMHTNNIPQQIDEDYDDDFSKGSSERDSESIANSPDDTNSAVTSSQGDRHIPTHCNRIEYDQLQEQQSPFKRNSNASLLNIEDQQNSTAGKEINTKGLKILFRMYMGRLKVLSELISDIQSAELEQKNINEEILSLRMDCISFMMRRLQELRIQRQHHNNSGPIPSYHLLYYGKSFPVNGSCINDQKLVFVPFIPDYKLQGEKFDQHLKSYVRPIPSLYDRPQYLNRLPPFKRADFSYPNKEEGETEVHFMSWHNELLTLTLKIQSLLASTKIEQDIIEEFIAFVQKTPYLLGIDSFLVIVLPKHLAINYMLNFCPEYLWQYGKSNNFTPKQWESLFQKILGKKELLPNWKTYITEILNNLVADLNFEELLQCFPSEVIHNCNIELWGQEFNTECITAIDNTIGGLIFEQENTKESVPLIHTIRRDHLPMDNVDENNVFELTLRKAVSKQRSIALRSMVESTGKQLFDAISNPIYNF